MDNSQRIPILKSFSQFLSEENKLWFHISPYKFKYRLLPMTHFGSADQIRDRIKTFTDSELGNIGDNVKNVYGVKLNLRNGFEIEDRGVHHTHYHIIDQLHEKGVFSDKEKNSIKNEIRFIYDINEDNTKNAHKYGSELLANHIRNKGYDHLYYHNKGEGNIASENNISVIITHPKQVQIVYHNPNLKRLRNKK